jgi:hypothetical protein
VKGLAKAGKGQVLFSYLYYYICFFCCYFVVFVFFVVLFVYTIVGRTCGFRNKNGVKGFSTTKKYEIKNKIKVTIQLTVLFLGAMQPHLAVEIDWGNIAGEVKQAPATIPPAFPGNTSTDNKNRNKCKTYHLFKF